MSLKRAFGILLVALFSTLTLCRGAPPRRLENLQTKSTSQPTQDRKLILDFFKTSDEANRDKKNQSAVKKLINILQLADSFHDDPNFDVNVVINYRNEPGIQELASNVPVKAKARSLKLEDLQNIDKKNHNGLFGAKKRKL